MARHEPAPGDVFGIRGRRLAGRVISTGAVVGPTHGSILVYVYADARLSRDALAAAPMLTTRAPWSHGLFEHLRAEPLRPGHALAAHAFRDGKGALFDAEGRPQPLAVAAAEIGEYRLLGVDAVLATLATVTAEYDVPPPGASPGDDAGVAARAVVAGWLAAFGRPPTREEWAALYDVAVEEERKATSQA